MACVIHKPILYNCNHKRYNFWRESSFHTLGDFSIYDYIKSVIQQFNCCNIPVDQCDPILCNRNYYVPKAKFVKQSDLFSPKLHFDWTKAIKHVLRCECNVPFDCDPYHCTCNKGDDKLKKLYLPKFPIKEKKSKNWINLNLVVYNITQDILGSCDPIEYCTCN